MCSLAQGSVIWGPDCRILRYPTLGEHEMALGLHPVKVWAHAVGP